MNHKIGGAVYFLFSQKLTLNAEWSIKFTKFNNVRNLSEKNNLHCKDGSKNNNETLIERIE